MKRVVCSLALVSAFSLAGLTACGDKVNVIQPGLDSSVTSVSVTPPSANLNVGDKVTFTATVTGGAGLTNRNVTWSSSTPTVATVDATTGVVTAVAGGTTSIIATSSANSSVRGAAAVTVAAAVQPTVTISTINQTIPGTGSVPANLSAVTNQLDVTLNVDPGTQKLSEVQLLMNCGGADTIVARQPVGSADKAPIDAEESSAPVTLSFNTAAFNTATGAVAFKNGACTIKGKAITTTGTFVATSGTPLTLANVDFVSATLTTTPSTGQNASATDGSGLLWRAGAVNVTAIPVIFSSAGSVASGTITLVNAGNDAAIGRSGNVAASVGAGGTVALQSNVAPASGVLTASFANDTTSTNAAGVGGAVVDTLSVVVTTVTSAGNTGVSLAASSANFIRLDNRGPDIATTAPTYIANTQNTAGGWVGKNFVFSVDSGSLNLGSATADNKAILVGFGANANSNGGVDKITVTTQQAPAGTSATSSAWANFTAVSSLTETASGSTLGVRLRLCDALGNCSTTAQLGTFGVDLTAPAFTITAGPKNLQVFNIASTLPSTQTIVPVDSTLTAGATPSGGNGALVSIQSLKPSGSSSSATACELPASTSACGTTVSLQPSSFTLPAGAVASGEFTETITAVDQAGNRGTPVTIKYYIDVAAPALSGGVSLPASIAAGTQFTSTATDNMDVAAGNGYLEFTTPAVKILQTGTASPTGATFDNALVRSAGITVTLSNFYRSMTAAAGTAGTKPINAGIRAIDAAGNLSNAQVVALPAANIANGSTIPNSGSTGITAFTTTIDSAAVAATHTVVMTSTSTPADAVNGGTPFAQVCFYFSSPTGTQGGAAGFGGGATGELIKIGCTGTVVVTQSPRLIVYSMPWTVPAGLASTSVNVFAVGNNTGGDALISSGVALTINAVPTPP